jgi:hypothetical protein
LFKGVLFKEFEESELIITYCLRNTQLVIDIIYSFASFNSLHLDWVILSKEKIILPDSVKTLAFSGENHQSSIEGKNVETLETVNLCMVMDSIIHNRFPNLEEITMGQKIYDAKSLMIMNALTFKFCRLGIPVSLGRQIYDLIRDN